MPEGDTIHRVAATMRPLLVDQPLSRLRLRDRGELEAWVGVMVLGIDVLGKHMMIRLSATDRPDGWTLRIHLGMRGRWHRYPPGHRWRRPLADASIVVATQSVEFVCFGAAVAELRRTRDLGLTSLSAKLGPDLIASHGDLREVVSRARNYARSHAGIGELLLDQRVASGIGNVYKSEVLFLTKLLPSRGAHTVDDETLRAVYERARELMRSNLGPFPRATVGELRGPRRRPETANLWVYRRAGLPCLRCRTRIERSLQGDQARSTYWCPRCQR